LPETVKTFNEITELAKNYSTKKNPVRGGTDIFSESGFTGIKGFEVISTSYLLGSPKDTQSNTELFSPKW
jgi:hypothetical protein